MLASCQRLNIRRSAGLLDQMNCPFNELIANGCRERSAVIAAINLLYTEVLQLSLRFPGTACVVERRMNCCCHTSREPP